MIDTKKPESEPNVSGSRSLAGLSAANAVWPFVISVLAESAETIRARWAAIFLLDDQSNQMRTGIVLEDEKSVNFLEEDRFVELREPFEVGHLLIWEELIAADTYRWLDLTDKAHPPFKWLIPFCHRLGLKRGLAVPLIFSAQPIGLAIFGCRRTKLPPIDRLEFVKNLLFEAALAIQLSRISHQAKGVEIVQEEVRTAREVHENMAQTLAAIAMQLAAAQSCLLKSDATKASRAVNRARELARVGIELARSTTLVLRPAQPASGGASRTIADLAHEAGRQNNLSCDFRQIGQIPQIVGAETEKALVQIANEALNNALQHGQPAKLEITLTWYADRVKLENYR